MENTKNNSKIYSTLEWYIMSEIKPSPPINGGKSYLVALKSGEVCVWLYHDKDDIPDDIVGWCTPINPFCEK